MQETFKHNLIRLASMFIVRFPLSGDRLPQSLTKVQSRIPAESNHSKARSRKNHFGNAQDRFIPTDRSKKGKRYRCGTFSSISIFRRRISADAKVDMSVMGNERRSETDDFRYYI